MFKENKNAPESGRSGSLNKLTLLMSEKNRGHLCTCLWEEVKLHCHDYVRLPMNTENTPVLPGQKSVLNMASLHPA